MRHIHTLAAVVLAASLAACASGSGRINWSNARQVKTGMTQQEVQQLMGQPYMIRSVAPGEVRWVWVYGSAFGGSESMTMTFKDGVASIVPEIPASFK